MKIKRIISIFLGIMFTINTMQNPIIVNAKEQTKKETLLNMLEEKTVTDLSQYEDQELIVIYQDKTTKKEKKQAFDKIETEEQKAITDWCDKVVLKNPDDLEQTLESLAENEDIAYVQPNFKYSAMSSVSSYSDIADITENEFAKQWWIYNDGTFQEPEETMDFDDFWSFYDRIFWPFETQTDSFNPMEDMIKSRTAKATAGIDSNTAKAWQQFKDGGRKTVVAVIDTGIDYSHSQLKDSMWTNYGEIPGNGIDDDGNGYIDDIYGWNFYYNSNEVYIGTSKTRNGVENEDEHGTHVAGIIAAAKDGIGTVGIASNANVELMSLKVLGKDGSGETEDIVKAIEYAEKQGAVICNMSFGINESDIPFYYQNYDQAMKMAIKNSSMLFIAAAGNDGMDNDSYGVYPSSYDFNNIISVGMLRCDGTLSNYSNYGMKTVDLAAPGAYIYSTLPNNQYGYESGTSMAAPMVTAACAMAYAYAKVPDVLAIRERILANVTILSSLSEKVATSGMLNVFDAVTDLANNEYTYEKENTVTENVPIENNNADTNGTTTNTDTTITPIENTNSVTESPSNNINSDNTNIEQGANEDVIGKKFIQNGIIYKIISSATAIATGAENSTSKKLTVQTEVIYQSKTYKVIKIKAKAFYKNQSVRQIKIGKNVKTIGESAFIGCKKLQKITGMAAVERIQSNAFKNCKKLQSIKLTNTVKAIADSAFIGCKKLKVKAVKGSYAENFIKKKGITISYQ